MKEFVQRIPIWKRWETQNCRAFFAFYLIWFDFIFLMKPPLKLNICTNAFGLVYFKSAVEETTPSQIPSTWRAGGLLSFVHWAHSLIRIQLNLQRETCEAGVFIVSKSGPCLCKYNDMHHILLEHFTSASKNVFNRPAVRSHSYSISQNKRKRLPQKGAIFTGAHLIYRADYPQSNPFSKKRQCWNEPISRGRNRPLCCFAQAVMIWTLPFAS